MMQRGFTVVELVITITIMGILLTLAVVNLAASQANGRDSERKSDIESIKAHLEAFYSTGTSTSTILDRYPSTVISAGDEAVIRNTLRDIDLDLLIAPNSTSVASTFISATNTVQSATGVLPQPSTSQYVYQPLQLDGSLCTTELQKCSKYNLYYFLEADNTVYMTTSKNQ